jgi:hypothetical protein
MYILYNLEVLTVFICTLYRWTSWTPRFMLCNCLTGCYPATMFTGNRMLRSCLPEIECCAVAKPSKQRSSTYPTFILHLTDHIILIIIHRVICFTHRRRSRRKDSVMFHFNRDDMKQDYGNYGFRLPVYV